MTTQKSKKSANRARAHDKKENRKRKGRHPRRRPSRERPIDFRLLVPERRLQPHQVPTARAVLLEQIQDHGSPSKACLAAGVGRRTFYDWLQEGEFRKAYLLARKIWRASVIGDVEASFGLRAQYKDTLAGIFLLKNNTKRYREVARVQLSGPDGGPILHADVKEELSKRLAKMLERREQGPLLQTGSGVEVRQLSAGPRIVKDERPRVRKVPKS